MYLKRTKVQRYKMFNALKLVGLRREEEVKIDMSWKGIDVTKM